MSKSRLSVPTALLVVVSICAVQVPGFDFSAVRAEVDFSKMLRPWDGFGVNYVEVAQTVDCDRDPQEYGGTYEVTRGYYYYKQICRAGKPGMGVARTMAMDSEIAVIGFAANGTKHPDAIVVVNIGKDAEKVVLGVRGTNSREFEAFRTTDDKDRYLAVGAYSMQDGKIVFEAPGRSVTTLLAK